MNTISDQNITRAAFTKLKLALRIGAATILVGCTSTVALSSEASGDNLAPSEIFNKAQEKYASLTSYSDEGKTVATLNGMTITTTFSIRLARPNFYRIEWEQSNDSTFTKTKAQTRAVWSAGEGDFLDFTGTGAQKQASLESALASATGISAGAAATVPGTFFKSNWGNQFGRPVSSRKQQADEKVGDVDCYVFTSELNGTTNTIWLGKQDFLIHQVRNITSAEAMKTLMADAAKRNPGILTSPQQFGGTTSTETHTKIAVNQKFLPADFTP